MNITDIKYFVDEHIDAYINISLGIGTICGLIACLYFHNCWWFFPPFGSILFISILFDWFLYKFSK